MKRLTAILIQLAIVFFATIATIICNAHAGPEWGHFNLLGSIFYFLSYVGIDIYANYKNRK